MAYTRKRALGMFVLSPARGYFLSMLGFQENFRHTEAETVLQKARRKFLDSLGQGATKVINIQLVIDILDCPHP